MTSLNVLNLMTMIIPFCHVPEKLFLAELGAKNYDFRLS